MEQDFEFVDDDEERISQATNVSEETHEKEHKKKGDILENIRRMTHILKQIMRMKPAFMKMHMPKNKL